VNIDTEERRPGRRGYRVEEGERGDERWNEIGREKERGR